MNNDRRCTRPVDFERLAVASAVAMLLGGGATAWAQTTHYTYSGNVSPVPANPQMQVFNAAGPLFVGSGAPGSFSALAGAQFTATALSIANGGVPVQTVPVLSGSWGSVTLDGAGTTAALTGAGNRLEIGNWGTGSLTVSGGAVLDATTNTAACGSGCYTFIGNAAGSTGTLTVTGTGSEVKTLGGFIVGHTSLVTGPPSFGTPGGTTSGNVNVLEGGKLLTGFALVGNNIGTSGEQAFGTVLVDGALSQWTVGRDGNQAARLAIGYTAGSTATVTVSGGGKLNIDNGINPGGIDQDPAILVGFAGKGTLIVTGTGSTVENNNTGGFINVGGIAGGDGSFQVLAGGSASTTFLNLGRNAGAVGTMLIDGANSVLTQSGVSTIAGQTGTATASIGRNGGEGTATVSNGGYWLITDGGQDGRSLNGSPQLSIGRDANSKGSLTITGNGSRVEVVSTSINPGVGEGDNNNPFVNIGRENAIGTGSAELMVSAGGKLVLTGNALSTVTHGRATTLNIGGRNGFGAKGTATVTGAGSEIILQGYDGLINVGRMDGSAGTLNVLNQSQVTSISMAVGIGTTDASPSPSKATGTVNIDNAKILLSGARTDGSNVGAGVTIGRGTNGVGNLNLSNGGRLEINSTAANGGMSIGGDQFLGGGSGTVTMTGGSSIVSTGQTIGMNIGWSGTGLVNLSGGSFINLAGGSISLAGVPTAGQSFGNGTLNLASGSKATINAINIGGNDDTVGAVGGTGTVSVSGTGSELTADGATGFIGVGRGGTGTLNVTDSGNVSAIVVSVGRNGGTGTFNATNATVQLAGQQTTGVLAGAAMVIGQSGGTGTMNMLNSTMSIQNALTSGSNGASLNLGGSLVFPGGSGTLNMTNSQVSVSAAAAAASAATVNIGRNGTGNATLNNSSITVSDGTAEKGSVFVGRDVGSTGTLTLNNGSTVNAGFVGIGVSAAGTGNAPAGVGGTGSLQLNSGAVNAARVELGAAGSVTVGAGGTLNVSSLGAAGVGTPISSSVYVAQQAGSTGTLVVGSATTPGAVLNADFVGIGVNAKAVGGVQSNGGAGTLVLNNSTINTKHFELGAGSTLTGNEGVINVADTVDPVTGLPVKGPVIIGGTISPGNSPGRIRIRCDVTTLAGSRLILDIDDNGVSFDIDQLIIGNTSKFDLQALQIIFNFIGTTNPDEFAQTPGGFNLGKFLRAEGEGDTTQDLSTLFRLNGNDYENWDEVLSPANFSATSAYYDVTEFRLGPNGEVRFEAAAIPEPSSVALALLALLAMMALSRRRMMRRA